MELTVLNISIIFLVIINLIALGVMFFDKWQASSGRRRVRETTLFLLAVFFGSLGVFLGMLMFRHKTKKWYFVLGVPLIIGLNLYLLMRLWPLINNYN